MTHPYAVGSFSCSARLRKEPTTSSLPRWEITPRNLALYAGTTQKWVSFLEKTLLPTISDSSSPPGPAPTAVRPMRFFQEHNNTLYLQSSGVLYLCQSTCAFIISLRNQICYFFSFRFTLKKKPQIQLRNFLCGFQWALRGKKSEFNPRAKLS